MSILGLVRQIRCSKKTLNRHADKIYTSYQNRHCKVFGFAEKEVNGKSKDVAQVIVQDGTKFCVPLGNLFPKDHYLHLVS